MWSEIGERAILDNTKEVYPGLIVAGMAANTVFGSPRMGAIFGGEEGGGDNFGGCAEVIKEPLSSTYTYQV